MKIERTGNGYRVRPERPHEELYSDLAAIGVLLAGLIAVMWIVL